MGKSDEQNTHLLISLGGSKKKVRLVRKAEGQRKKHFSKEVLVFCFFFVPTDYFMLQFSQEINSCCTLISPRLVSLLTS